jgi:hypothetical protein
VHGLDCPHHLSSASPFPSQLKQFQEVLPSISCMYMKPINSIPLPSLTVPFSHKYPHTLWTYLKSCLSFLISKSVFKGVSPGIPAVNTFGQFHPFCNSPLSLPSHPPLFNSFQYILLFLLPAEI